MEKNLENITLWFPWLEDLIAHLLVALVILVVGWAVSIYVGRGVRKMTSRSHRIDPTIVPMAYTVAVWGIRIIVLIAVLARLGVQTASIIAVLGAAGLAIGLALQGTLQNIAAGIMLLVLRPLRVGETVTVVTKAEGRVDEVGLFLTRFQQGDGTYITLPNSLVWGNPIINFSRNQARRIEFQVRLQYINDIDKVIGQLHSAVVAHALVLDTPAPDVSVCDYGDSLVTVRIQAWSRAADHGVVQKDLQHKAMQLIRSLFTDPQD